MLQPNANIVRAAGLAFALAGCAGSPPRRRSAGNSKSPIDITANEAEVHQRQMPHDLARQRRGAAGQDPAARRHHQRPFAKPKGIGRQRPARLRSRPRRIEAEGHVFYVSADQNARSDRAVYTAASDQVVMTGNVIVVQGNDVARGER